MAGITDLPFRLICKEMGAGLVYTEMVSSKALFYGDEKTKQLLKSSPKEKPLVVQIFGSDLEAIAYSAKYVSEFADIVDINMGCPAPKITKNGNKLVVPDELTLPYIEGDVVGVEITNACKKIVEHTVNTAYKGSEIKNKVVESILYIKNIISNYTSKTLTWEKEDTFTASKLRAQLDAGNPVIYLSSRKSIGSAKSDNDKGHFRVIYGYYRDSENIYVYLVYDPWDQANITFGSMFHRDLWRRSWTNIMDENAMIASVDEQPLSDYRNYDYYASLFIWCK